MRRAIFSLGLAALIAASLVLAPGEASADCRDRKVTGTVLGGVGGALLGNAVSGGGGGAVIGGLGGAVVGHEIGRSGCNRARPVAYRERAPAQRGSTRAARRPAEPPRVRQVYYDQYGQPVSTSAAYVPAVYSDGVGAACRTETHRFYDERGQLIERPTQVCTR